MNIQRLSIGGALILTLALAYWLAQHILPPPLRVHSQVHGSDYSAQQISLTQYRQNGQLRYQLQATRMVHTQTNRLTRLTDPILMVYPAKSTPVTLHSPTALLDTDNGKILMPQNVIITRTNPQGVSSPTLITSSNVTVDTRQQTASSSMPTRIKGSGYVITGSGLRADFKQQTFSLLKDVQSVYVPDSTKP